MQTFLPCLVAGSKHIYVKPGNDLHLSCGAGTNCLVGIIIILPQEFIILPLEISRKMNLTYHMFFLNCF